MEKIADGVLWNLQVSARFQKLMHALHLPSDRGIGDRSEAQNVFIGEKRFEICVSLEQGFDRVDLAGPDRRMKRSLSPPVLAKRG